MNKTWVGVALTLAGLAAACGQGRAIFNVDVYSFLQGSKNDTVHYVVPPVTNNQPAPTPAIKISLVPGLGSSGIDTVKVTGTADFRNDSGGPGNIRFQVYLAKDSLGTFNAGRDSMFSPAPSANLAAGVNTVSVPFTASNLSPTGNALFSNSEVWIRVGATVSNSGATFMGGRVVLTSLGLRVVVQDKLF